MSPIPVRVALQQRVLPVYRATFFETLAKACPAGLDIFAGQPRPEEAIECANHLQRAGLTTTLNHHFFNGRFYLCWQSGLIKWLEGWQPGVLIAEANPRYLSSPPAIHWMKSHQRPVIGWGLGASNAHGVFSSLRGAARWNFLQQFDALITYSQAGAREYQAAGYASERIFIAPNAAAAKPRHALPQRSDTCPNGQAIVIFIGRLQARKRVDFLIRACADLPQALRPRLWIVGDGPERESLANLAAGVYPQTEFFGARFADDLEDLMRQADLLVLPGTGGLAIQQGMSYGLPVIVAEADGTQADLVRPENGWQIPPGNLAILTDSMQRALEDIPRLRRMGAASYQITASEINLETMVSAFEQAIQFVLER